MKTLLSIILLFLYTGITSFAQTDIILHDTIFYYSFSNPDDSILVSMHCTGSDSADRVITKLIFEEGEGMEEGGEDSVNIKPMVKVWRDYDSTGNLILELIDHMDRETARFEKWQKNEWKYDENGRILQYSNYSYLNNEVSSFSSHRKEYQYDSAGNILIDIYSKLYGEDQAEYKKKVESGYDSLGNLILKKEFEWYGVWSIKSKTIYSYNEENILIKTERSTSTRIYITDYLYDGSGRIRTEMELIAEDNSEIKPKVKNEYFYTATGDTVKKIRYNYKIETEDWQPVSREDYINDSLKRITYEADYIWDHQKNRWKGLSSFERTYNEKGDIIYRKNYQWNDNPGQWEQIRYNHYTFSDYGSLKISSTYTWVEANDDFIISSRTYTKLDYYKTEKSDSICAEETYEWQGDIIQESGTHKKSYTSIGGRDSIYILNLYIFDFSDLPEFVIDGDSEILELDTSVYSITEVDGVIYDWNVENGTILSQPGNNVIEVQWGSKGIGSITCSLEHHEHGCKLDTVEFEVLLIPSGYEKIHSQMYSVYPNPVNTILKINSPANLSYKIMNLQGKVFISTLEKEIDVEKLPPGSYFLIFKDRKGKLIHRQLFIKSR